MRAGVLLSYFLISYVPIITGVRSLRHGVMADELCVDGLGRFDITGTEQGPEVHIPVGFGEVRDETAHQRHGKAMIVTLRIDLDSPCVVPIQTNSASVRP